LTSFVYQPLIEQEIVESLKVELLLHIPENLYYFQGHFPQAAVLPGVAQIDWVMDYISTYFNLDKRQLVSIDALKFQVIIRPSYTIKLSLTKMTNNKVSFSYHSEHGQHASGKVVYNES